MNMIQQKNGSLPFVYLGLRHSVKLAARAVKLMKASSHSSQVANQAAVRQLSHAVCCPREFAVIGALVYDKALFRSSSGESQTRVEPLPVRVRQRAIEPAAKIMILVPTSQS